MIVPGKSAEPCFSLACGISRVFAIAPTLSCRLFENSEFIFVLAYMADIFEAFNYLNQQIQSGGVNTIEVQEHLKAF